MSFLTKTFVLFLFCLNSYAKDNPFSIMMNVSNNDTAGEQSQHLVLKIRSVSHDQARFLIKVQVPKTHIEVIEGKDYYKGVLKGLEEKEFFLVIKGTKEGEGDINVRVFSLIDEMKIDNDNSRLFYAKYKVSKELVISLGDVIEKEANVQTKQGVQIGSVKTDETPKVIEIKAEDIDNKKASQHFVIEGTFRHNKIYRNLMVLVSLLIVGYLYMRIRKPL